MVAIRPLGKVLLILMFLSHHILLRGFFFPPSSRCPRLAIFGVSTLFSFFVVVPLGLGLNWHFYHTSLWFFSGHPLSSGLQCNYSSTQQSDTFF